MTEKDLKQLAALLSGGTNCKQLAISSAWDNFITYSRINCRLSTIDYYNKLWKVLDSYFKSLNIVFVDDINKQTLSTMINTFKNRKWNNNTINKYIDQVKMIVKYNFDNEYIATNNIFSFKKLPKYKPDIKIISTSNEQLILAYMGSLNLDKDCNLRNVLFLYLFKDTGVRLNELLNIEAKNVNINDNSIFLSFTKTKDTRTVFFSDYTKVLLNRYLKEVNPQNFLFILLNGEKMKRATVYDFLKRISLTLNIDQSITPHKWRHTLATKLLDHNINLESIRNIMGHTTLSTTQKYLHLSKSKIKKDILDVL